MEEYRADKPCDIYGDSLDQINFKFYTFWFFYPNKKILEQADIRIYDDKAKMEWSECTFKDENGVIITDLRNVEVFYRSKFEWLLKIMLTLPTVNLKCTIKSNMKVNNYNSRCELLILKGKALWSKLERRDRNFTTPTKCKHKRE